MQLSKAGYELIKSLEGVKTKAYQDSVGIWTIGVGFIRVNGKPVVKGQTMTESEIETEFFKQLGNYENPVNDYVTKTLTQNQFDALVSFVFNVGGNAFRNSTLLKKINADPKDKQGITSEWKKWNRAGGKVIQGLTNRRLKELNYYFS